MKLTKKIIALMVIITMSMSFVACGGDKGNDKTENIMEDAMRAMESVESYDFEMSMDMNLSVAGQKIESTTTGGGSCINNPMLLKMNLGMDMGDAGAMDVLMYAEIQDDSYITYMSVDEGATWMKQVTADPGLTAQYDMKESMNLYLSSIESFKEGGTETLNGKEAVRYDGVISKDAMDEVMAASGASEQLAPFLAAGQDASDLYKDLGELPMSIWIEKETLLPVKYEMDMTGIMQSLMVKLMDSMADQMENTELSVEKMFASMSLYNFNSVEVFEIPEAAKNASEM